MLYTNLVVLGGVGVEKWAKFGVLAYKYNILFGVVCGIGGKNAEGW